MRGLMSTIMREVPQYVIYFPVYHGAKLFLTDEGQSADAIPAHKLALAGAFAGVIQWLPPMYSVDVIKSRIQSSKPGTYKGIMDCAVKSVRNEGPGVFIRGITPTLIRAAPLHGTIFCVYEVAMRLLSD